MIFINGKNVRGNPVGTIALGKPCDSTFKIETDYYRVNLSDVRIKVAPTNNNVIARCALQ